MRDAAALFAADTPCHFRYALMLLFAAPLMIAADATPC